MITPQSATNDRVARHIQSLNEAWQAQRFEALDGFYHPDVVLLPPDGGTPIMGRAAVVATYREFADTATLHEFQITSLDVYAFETTAICHLRFEIEYQIERGRFRESGLEVYVLSIAATADETSDTTQPVIVWRSQAVLETAEVLPARSAD